MADELYDILSSDQQEINREQLLKYLQGELTPEEQHEVEKAMMESDMMSDAVEGLQSISDSQKLPLIQDEINRGIQKLMQKRKSHKQKRKIKDLYWVMVFVIIVLIIAVVAFAVIYLERKG